jgi:hypothetical protein
VLYEVLHFMAEREKYGSLNLGLDNSSQIKKEVQMNLLFNTPLSTLSLELPGEICKKELLLH